MLKNKTIGTKKTLTITDGPTILFKTDGTAYVDSFGDPVLLPTSKPATAQLVKELSASNLPVFSSIPVSVHYSVAAFMWGRNTDGAATHQISYNTRRNGADVVADTTLATNITANYYWTLMMSYASVADPTGANQDIEFFVWDTSGNLDIRGMAVVVYPTKIQTETNKILKDFSWGGVAYSAPFAGVGLNPGGTSDNYYRWDELRSYVSVAADSTKNVIYAGIPGTGTPYCFTHEYMDGSNSNLVRLEYHSSIIPSFRQPRYPHTISYRILYPEGKL